MSRQNIFDNETFFEGYKSLRELDTNYNDLLEQPTMRKLLPDLMGKAVLDLGCGCAATKFARWASEVRFTSEVASQ